MRVWVTGATGQIGRKLCLELHKAGHDVVAFSREKVDKSFDYQWVQWDMASGNLNAEELIPPDVVFHLAAQTSAYQARNDLPGDVRTNILGFVWMLESLRQMQCFPHVILAGAATEVGAATGPLIGDTDPDNPSTFYDVGKVSQRLFLRQCGTEGWLEGTTIRFPNVYGGLNVNASNDRGFLNASIRRAVLGKNLQYYADGDYVRDFLHVQDVVTALISAMENRKSVANDTFIIGTGVGTKLRDVLSLVARQAESLTRIPVRLIPTVSPAGLYDIEKRNAVMDASRFSLRTNWKSRVTLECGIQESIDFCLNGRGMK